MSPTMPPEMRVFALFLSRRLAAALVIATTAAAASAQRLALRTFGIADGLADSRINDVREDSRGFVWIATWEGLSRFDGQRFVNYGTRDGLGALLVNSVTEDAERRLWVATNGGGIARLDESPGRELAFESFTLGADSRSNNVNELLFDQGGDAWCATDAGIYRGRLGAAGELVFECVAPDSAREVNWWRAGARGPDALYFAAGGEVLRVREGEFVRGAAPRADPERSLVHLAAAADGRLLAAYPDALFETRADPPLSADDWRRIDLELGQDQELRFVLPDGAGQAWIATSRGLFRLAGGVARQFTAANGLPDEFVRTLHEDSQGHLWIGTLSAGVARLVDPTLASFGADEGLDSLDVRKLIVTREHGIVGASARGDPWRIAADRVERLEGLGSSGAGPTRGRIALDGFGRWWLGYDEALATCVGPVPRLAERVLADASVGWPSGGVAQNQGMGIDALGRAWIGRIDGSVLRADAEGRLTEAISGLPLKAARIAFDSAGAAWITGAGLELDREFLVRWRDGTLDRLEPAAGLPEVVVRAMHCDRGGRMWLALRSRGVSFTDDPAAATPAFRNLSSRDGLPSDDVRAIAEDAHGAIWLGTGRGLVRLDLEHGLHETWTSADGLSGDTVNALAFDADGALWVGTLRGVTRFDPRAPRAEPRRRVVVTRVVLSGEEFPLPDRGLTQVELPPLPASRGNVEIGFVALPSSPRPLAFEMKLESGRSDETWSAPSSDTSVHLLRPSPGDYRLRLRLAGSEAGETVVAFAIEPPLWRRSWFLAAAATALGGLLLLAHRVRVARAVALERIRRQIALDLHDDLGAGLAQIAIQTEVARREVGPAPSERLGRIAELSRSLRSSMDDIVWSIDPRKDHASDLFARMRRVASELGDGDAFQVELRVSGQGPEQVELAPERRRHVFLIFKEALTNAARHASARRIEVEVALGARELSLEIRDDGRGFDPAAPRSGRGLSNLSRRAAELGAKLSIDSAPGRGTRIVLGVPLRGRAHPHNGAVGSEPQAE